MMTHVSQTWIAKSAKNAKDAKTEENVLGSNNASNTILEQRFIEVDQKTKMQVHRFEVRNHLRSIERVKAFRCFGVDDETAVDEKIQPAESGGDLFVQYRNAQPPLVWDAPEPELIRKSFFVDRLAESRPENSMYLDRSPDDLARPVINLGVWFHLPPLFSLTDNKSSRTAYPYAVP
jgi:hypothetical protein